MVKTITRIFFLAFFCIIFVMALPFIPAVANLNQSESAKVYNKVAYVTSWNWNPNIDVTTITHANYSFGIVSNDGKITVNSPEYLEQLISKKAENPELKVVLSLQQENQGGFCGVVSSENNFSYFMNNCAQLLEDYKIDGFDVDWEYPGLNLHTGEVTCNNCKSDFTKLITSLRKLIGDEKYLSIACGVSQYLQQYTDFAAINNSLDYFNLMAYDFQVGNISGHQSNLYASSVGSVGHGLTADDGVKLLISKGVPANKINLGVPFYSRTSDGGEYKYSKIEEFLNNGYTYGFDEAAQQSYLHKDGVFAVAYDDVRTLKVKVDYTVKNDLAGIMFWEYGQDDTALTLSKTVFNAYSEYEKKQGEIVEPIEVDVIAPKKVVVGQKVNFSVKVTGGGDTDYKFDVYVLRNGYIVYSDIGSKETDFSFTPMSAGGRYDYKVYCRDSVGNSGTGMGVTPEYVENVRYIDYDEVSLNNTDANLGDYLGTIPVLECYIDDSKQKPIVIFQHGLSTDKSYVQEYLREFANRGFYAISIDAYGHGERSNQVKISTADVVKRTSYDIDNVLRYYKGSGLINGNPDVISVGGLSIGASVTFYYAAYGDVKCNAIVSLSGTPDLTSFESSIVKTMCPIDYSYVSENDLPEFNKAMYNNSAINSLTVNDRLKNTYILMINGLDDKVVSSVGSVELQTRLSEMAENDEELKVEFIGIENAGHDVTVSELNMVYDYLVNVHFPVSK